MDALISVIIPLYNSEKFMNKCIDSVINQSYKNLEIFLVNDGSTDGTLKLCKQYAIKDERIKIIDKQNGGAASARNVALDVCNGDYISFIDSDDWIEKNTYEFLLDEIKKECDLIIFTACDEYDNGLIKYKKRAQKKYLSQIDAITMINSFSNITNSPCDKIYKKSIFDDIRFPEGTICEDYYLIPNIVLKSKSIVYLPNVLYHCIQRDNSVSRNSSVKFEYIDASYKQKQFIDKNYPDISYVGNTAYVFANITIYNSIILNNKCLDKIDEIWNNSKKYKKDVYFNKNLPIKKKIQAFIFFNNLKLYNKIILKIKQK